MRAINTAQQNYSQQCNGYAPLLTELKAAGNYLSLGRTNGGTVATKRYNMTLAAGESNAVLATQAPGCTAAGTNYYGSAVPLTKGSTGTRAFATDEQGTIWQNSAGTAPPQPFTAGGTISVIP